jgi:glycosyltransferase involved in cell wall biosynthesis
MKKCMVVGPILTQTGYGEHARMIYRALKSRPDLYDVYVRPVNWGDSSWIFEDDEERKKIDTDVQKAHELQQKGELPDVAFLVTIPNEWQQYRAAPLNIGVCAGIETDRTSLQWLEAANLTVDKIIVPSSFSKEVFENSTREFQTADGQKALFRLEKAIETIHYPVKTTSLVDVDLEKVDTKFNFLYISQWGPRKNLESSIRWFLEEFKDEEDIGFVIKTNKRGNSKLDYHEIRAELGALKGEYPDSKCSIYLLHGYLNEDELHSLYKHDKIKALVNFSHGEGFGLPLFEAVYSALPVISHDWGGQKDFLWAKKKDKKTGKEKSRAHYSRAVYELRPVQDFAVWPGVIEADSQWAYVNPQSAKIAMRDVYENYDVSVGTAKRLQKEIKKNFSEKVIYEKFYNFVDGLFEVQDVEDWLAGLDVEEHA